MKITVSPAAAADVQRLRAFLEEKDAGSAKRAVQAILSGMRSLAVFPERGRKATVRGLRELVVRFGRSAYVVRYIYRPRASEIVVVRVWHGRERRWSAASD